MLCECFWVKKKLKGNEYLFLPESVTPDFTKGMRDFNW